MASFYRSIVRFALGIGLALAVLSANADQILTFDDPTPTYEDGFGWSVAIDSNHALIGAPFDHTNGGDVGQVHLFDTNTGALLQTFDDPEATVWDYFGRSVALDGNRALVSGGDFYEFMGVRVRARIGKAYLFNATTGALLRTFEDPTPPTTYPYDTGFGMPVALDGNRVLVGDSNGYISAGQAHLFDTNTGALLQTFDDPTPTGRDGFGRSVAIDGNRALIGAPFDDTNGERVGQVHLFDTNTGALLQTFDDPTPTDADTFGWSVAIDGNRALIGAPADDTNGGDVGQVHLFDTNTGALLQTFDEPMPTLPGVFGDSVAIDDNRVLISGAGAGGQVHLFDATTGVLLQTFEDPPPTNGDGFGSSVALDGNRALIGASYDSTNGERVGQAYLFLIPLPPTITTQPTNQSVVEGQAATFTVVASGTSPLSYQWQKNGGNISGAAASSYTTPATTTSDNGATYRVIVNNAQGSVTSSPATLSVSARDSDGDGVPDNQDAFPSDPNESKDTDNDGIGNNADTDDDNDGLLDIDEVNTYGTSPVDPDSDNDGLSDGQEVAQGLDPLDPSDGGPFLSQAGSNCMAILQKQAFELQWTEKYIENVSTTRGLWITCPLPRVTGVPNQPLNLALNLENPTGEEHTVTCIARRYDVNGVLQEAASTDASVPATGRARARIVTTETPADFDYYSLTCALPRGVALTHYVTN